MREPTRQETDIILKGVAPIYEKFHGVAYSQDSLRASVRLTDRFIADRSLPAKAIDLLDRAGARVGRESRELVERSDIVAVLAGLVDLPLEFLSVSPSKGLKGMDVFLQERVVGHEKCVEAISRVLGQNWARFGSRRPLGSFVFAGSKGVGKRTTALAIAEFLFGSANAFMDIDLADYAEAHSLSHLIGSPPGYVGHEEGGILSDALTRRPFLVIQWRNVDQAHRSVYSLLAQILAEGTSTDRRGRRMDFRNTVHVLTTGFDPVGGDESGGRSVGFGTNGNSDSGPSASAIRARCKRMMPGDLVAAVDEVLAFRQLRGNIVLDLTRLLVRRAIVNLQKEHMADIEASPELVDAIVGFCSGEKGDATAIESHVTRLFSRPIADYLLTNGSPEDGTLCAMLANMDGKTPLIGFSVTHG